MLFGKLVAIMGPTHMIVDFFLTVVDLVMPLHTLPN
jgi:hypothetical protein